VYNNFDHAWLERTMKFIGNGIGAPTEGKFQDVRGTSVYTVAEDPKPIGAAARPMAGADGPWELAHAGTVAAARALTRGTSPANADINDTTLLHTDEIPGARVVKIEKIK
jgi:hypothetical protein